MTRNERLVRQAYDDALTRAFEVVRAALWHAQMRCRCEPRGWLKGSLPGCDACRRYHDLYAEFHSLGNAGIGLKIGCLSARDEPRPVRRRRRKADVS